MRGPKLQAARGETGGGLQAGGHQAVRPHSPGGGQPTPAAGLTAACDEPLAALQCLQAILEPSEFWTPRTLESIPTAVVDAFLVSLMKGQRPLLTRLEQAWALRDRPTIERIQALPGVIRGMRLDEGLRRAVAWAAGLPLEIGGQYGDGQLHLNTLPISWLPEGLELDSLSIEHTKGLRSLPGGLSLMSLSAGGSALERLPEDLQVSDIIRLNWCHSLEGLPSGLSCPRITLAGCSFRELPSDLRVSDWLDVRWCRNLRALPDGLCCRDIDATESGIESFGGGVNGRNYNFLKCPHLGSLPSGLRLEYLALDSCPISSLPPDLVVTGVLSIRGTPLSERFSEDDIRAMAPGVTGMIIP